MKHVNFMFVPGSCGNFFVKSLHLNDSVILDSSMLNRSTPQVKFEAYSYSSFTDYRNWNYIEFEMKDSGDGFTHFEFADNYVTIWYMNNHAFTDLQTDNILGESDTELRLLMDLTDMEKFVICNGYKKNNKFESCYVDQYNNIMGSNDLQYISLKRIVENETTFMTEYKRILSLMDIFTVSNEHLVLRLYNEWKTTLPDVSSISTEEFMFGN